ncbi:hypothetical protein XELAEV_18022005mg [Xenopus laevis]|uniref:Uncharacterized protein n=1 Tax=Xenopus laevis TaxID=8355 RepID=A0A974HN87_XENLA|nr:hypothetical protein XELAEV_18022005mg [Xenopus laevis]
MNMLEPPLTLILFVFTSHNVYRLWIKQVVKKMAWTKKGLIVAAKTVPMGSVRNVCLDSTFQGRHKELGQRI